MTGISCPRHLVKPTHMLVTSRCARTVCMLTKTPTCPRLPVMSTFNHSSYRTQERSSGSGRDLPQFVNENLYTKPAESTVPVLSSFFDPLPLTFSEGTFEIHALPIDSTAFGHLIIQPIICLLQLPTDLLFVPSSAARSTQLIQKKNKIILRRSVCNRDNRYQTAETTDLWPVLFQQLCFGNHCNQVYT